MTCPIVASIVVMRRLTAAAQIVGHETQGHGHADPQSGEAVGEAGLGAARGSRSGP